MQGQTGKSVGNDVIYLFNKWLQYWHAQLDSTSEHAQLFLPVQPDKRQYF